MAKKGCLPRSGETWTSVRVRHGRPSWTAINTDAICFIIANSLHVLQKSQTELLGIVGVSFCQNFATCALHKSQFLDLIFAAGGSYTSSCVSQHPSGPRLLQPPGTVYRSLLSLLVHALHCQPKVQGNAACHFLTPST